MQILIGCRDLPVGSEHTRVVLYEGGSDFFVVFVDVVGVIGDIDAVYA